MGVLLCRHDINQTHDVAVTRAAHQNRTIGRRLFADQDGRACEGFQGRQGQRSYKPNQDDEFFRSFIDRIHDYAPLEPNRLVIICFSMFDLLIIEYHENSFESSDPQPPR